jgi:heme/copper-type cytochrome/quinol oxidase subunit 2
MKSTHRSAHAIAPQQVARHWTHILVFAVVSLAAGPALAGDTGAEAPRKVIKMTAENWKWVPDKITVTKGTVVELHIRSYDSTHRFDLKDFGQKVLLPQGEVTNVEFLADKVGTFKWKCGRPCGDGCPKMRGKLTVVEPEPDSGG